MSREGTGPQAIAADASLMPQGIDGVETIRFARIDPAKIRRMSFLDGREPVGEPGPSAAVPALAAALHGAPTPMPTIFHVSFCGSTLLARLLDRPGETLVYREPAIQIALADRVAAGVPIGSALRVADALLARPVQGERTVVKPTNWVNTLLPIWSEAEAVRPLFVTMAPDRFLTAVFRGGRDRIAFTLRTVPHFATALPTSHALMEAAIAGGIDPSGQAARLVLVGLHQQQELFAAARSRLSLGDEHLMDETEIRADPTAAAIRTTRLLGLAEPEPPAAQAHAKDPSRSFDPAEEADANRAVLREHGATFAAALDWAAAQGLLGDA